MIITRLGNVEGPCFFQGGFYNTQEYGCIPGLADSDIAWEALRRNPYYQADYYKAATQHELIVEIENSLIEQSINLDGPKNSTDYYLNLHIELEIYRELYFDQEVLDKWRLSLLEHPNLNGNKATLNWKPDTNVASIRYVVKNQPDWRGKTNCFKKFYGSIIHFTGEGYLVTVPYGGENFQFQGTQSPFLKEGERLIFLDDKGRTTTKNIENMTRARSLFPMKPQKNTDEPIRKKRKTKRKKDPALYVDVFRAYDGFSLGLENKEIAFELFKDKNVQDHWNDGNNHYQNMTKRLIKAGKSLVNGGYKGLLSKADN